MRLNRKGACTLIGLLVVVCASVALASSSASAEVASPASAEFCVNNTVNNVQRCFGAPRQMNSVTGIGIQTGACVGYDTSGGTCSPVGYPAEIYTPLGEHQPWIMGTAAALTYVNAYAGVLE
jgi:hypothetical protein